MQFKVNDIVAVIDDVIKGKVMAVSKETIQVESTDGFMFNFSPSELVVIKENQKDLAKFSDINNEHLIEKIEASSKKNLPKFKSTLKPEKLPPMEVDLHIQNLASTTRGLDNYDMLTLQIETAQRKLEFAIRNRIPKVIFIHGVGEGVLKSELEFLFKKYPVEWYEASFKKYGLGATEVYIYQNPK